jgi:hypothetical protein
LKNPSCGLQGSWWGMLSKPISVLPQLSYSFSLP